MSVFKPINSNDIYITPFSLNKNYKYNSYDDYGYNGPQSYRGVYKWYKTNQEDLSNTVAVELLKTTNGIYEYVAHDSMNHMFYDKFSTDPLSTLTKSNIGQFRELNEEIKYISIPQSAYAEKIKEGSIKIIDYTAAVSQSSSLIVDPNFQSTALNWYQGHANPIGTSSLILNALNSYTLDSQSFDYGTKKTWLAAKIVNMSASISMSSWIEELYLTSSLSSDITNGSCYKLTIDIENVSSYYPIPSLSAVNVDMPFSTLNLQISGTGGSLNTINVPYMPNKYEYEIYSDKTITDAKIIIHASQSVDLGIIAAELLANSINQTDNKITFNEISLVPRPTTLNARLYEDDSIGNLYDVNSKNELLDNMNEHLVGAWTFVDGYINSKDDRRGVYTKDESIYMNNGICTNVEFVDGIYGKSAKFNNDKIITDIIVELDEWTISASSSHVISKSTGYTYNNSGSIPSYDSSWITSNNEIPVYTLHDYTSSISTPGIYPTILSPTVLLQAGKIYKFSYRSKSTYINFENTPSWNFKINNGNTTFLSGSHNSNIFWDEHLVYFTIPSESAGNCNIELYTTDMTSSITFNSIDYNNHICVSNLSHLKLSEIDNCNNVRIWNSDSFNFDTWEKFALECIVKIPQTQIDTLNGDYNIIVAKNGRRKEVINNANRTYADSLHTNSTASTNYLTGDEMNVDTIGRYPYQLAVYNQNSQYAGKIFASRYDGERTLILSSSTSMFDGNSHHVLFQKTGSRLEFYVDGNIESTCEDFVPETPSNCSDRRSVQDVFNMSDLFIGSRGDDKYIFRGEVDSVKIYNESFDDTTINELYTRQFNNTYHWRVGNVFYEQGIITVTNPYARYTDSIINTGSISTYESGYKLTYNGNLTAYEVEVHCPTSPTDYNYTLNRTARRRGDMETDQLACFATHSEFTPYVTTVGLYNEDAELVAIGKVSKPIKKLKNLDTTFVIKFDI